MSYYKPKLTKTAVTFKYKLLLQQTCQNPCTRQHRFLQWDPAVLEQAIARSYRIGQAKDVKAYLMACDKSIDTSILKIIQLKKNIISSFSNGPSDTDKKGAIKNDESNVKKLYGELF